MLDTTLSRRLAFSAALALAGLALSGCMEPSSSEKKTTAHVVTPPASLRLDTSAIEARLQKIDSKIKVESVSPTPIKGIIEIVMVGGQSTYANEDATYLLNGKIFQLTDDGLIDLSLLKQQEKAIKVMQTVPEHEMIVYAAQNQKAFITVFTDIDCPYCHKLHAEIPKLNELGVTVRYMAFPRMGVDSDTGNRMKSVWCATDRKAAMDLAMSRQPIDRANCESPVASHFEKAHSIGVSGTPTVIFSDGTVRPGFSEAQELAEAAIKAAAVPVSTQKH